MKNQSQAGANRPAKRLANQSARKGRSQLYSWNPTPTLAAVLRDGELSISAPLNEVTIDAPSIVSGRIFHHSEALALLCAFIKNSTPIIRSHLLDAFDLESPAVPLWIEALTIAPAVLCQQFLGMKPTGEQNFFIPLPGAAGMIEYGSYRLLVHLSILIYFSRDAIRECFITHPPQHPGLTAEITVQAAEAIMIARCVADYIEKSETVAELIKTEAHFPPAEEPSQQRAA